jgi:hypothetical protein
MSRKTPLASALAMTLTLAYAGVALAQSPADMFKTMGDAIKQMEQRDQQAPQRNAPPDVQSQQGKPAGSANGSPAPKPSQTSAPPQTKPVASREEKATLPQQLPGKPVEPQAESAATNDRSFNQPGDSAEAMPWITKGAELACRGDRWLGSENVYLCGKRFLSLCEYAIYELGYRPNGCPSAMPREIAKKLDWLGGKSNQEFLQKPVSKEALLNPAPTRAEIDKKLAYIERACTQMFPRLESERAAILRWRCFIGAGALSLGSAPDFATNKVSECNSPYLSSDVASYCTQKLVSWLQKMQSALAPIEMNLARKETEQYMSGSAAQAKKKIDEIIASGDRRIESLKGWCNRLYGPLELNKDEFLPKCERYVTLKLDSLTGGQASKDAAANELSNTLSTIYFAHMMAQACYDARKEFKIQYVTSGQLDQATKAKNAIESDLVKKGANKDAAFKHANNKFAPSKEMLSASQSQYMDSRKQACADNLDALRLFASTVQ